MRRVNSSAVALAVAGWLSAPQLRAKMRAGCRASGSPARRPLPRLCRRGRDCRVVTYVSRHGQIVHEDAYGRADIDDAARRRATLLYVYSMTKPVTSVAPPTLYEEGKFRLTEPIARYPPEPTNAACSTATGAASWTSAPAHDRGRVPPHRRLSLRAPRRDGLRPRLSRGDLTPTSRSSRGSSASCRSAIGPARGGSTRSQRCPGRLVEVLWEQPFDEFVWGGSSSRSA